MGNTMFKTGQTPEPSLTEGTFLAYLLPPPDDNNEYEWISTQNGGAYKLRYNVFVPGMRGTRRFEQSELASPVASVGSKLTRRICAANNVTPSDKIDLSALNLEGWVMIQLGKKAQTNYLEIKEVLPLPKGYPVPTDIDNPRTPPTKQTIMPEVGMNVADEPPF